jgi:hypothetical protein
LKVISDPVEAANALALGSEISLIIACAPRVWVELFRNTRGDALPIIVVYHGASHRTRALLACTAATAITLQWPFFPSDLVSAIALLQTGQKGTARHAYSPLADPRRSPMISFQH